MEVTLNTWHGMSPGLEMVAFIQNIIAECEPGPLRIQEGFQSWGHVE